MFNSDTELRKATDKIFYASLVAVVVAFVAFGFFVFSF